MRVACIHVGLLNIVHERVYIHVCMRMHYCVVVLCAQCHMHVHVDMLTPRLSPCKCSYIHCTFGMHC